MKYKIGDIVKYDGKYHVITSLRTKYLRETHIEANEINNDCTVYAATESFVFVSELEALLFLP